MRKIIDMLISYEIPFSYEMATYHTIIISVKDYIENAYVIYKTQDKMMTEHNEVMGVHWEDGDTNVRLLFTNVWNENKEEG